MFRYAHLAKLHHMTKKLYPWILFTFQRFTAKMGELVPIHCSLPSSNLGEKRFLFDLICNTWEGSTLFTCVQILKLENHRYIVYGTVLLTAHAPGVLQVIMGHFAWLWVFSKNWIQIILHVFCTISILPRTFTRSRSRIYLHLFVCILQLYFSSAYQM